MSIAHADPTINTPWLAAYQELRARWPQVDPMTVMDAASQLVAEQEAVADEVDAKPHIGFDEPEPEFVLEVALDRRIADTQAAIDEANELLSGLGYTDAELDEMYADCREADSIGRDESLRPWRY